MIECLVLSLNAQGDGQPERTNESVGFECLQNDELKEEIRPQRGRITQRNEKCRIKNIITMGFYPK